MTRQYTTHDMHYRPSMVGQTLGGKRLVRDLGQHELAQRYLGHDLRRSVDCLIYVFDHSETGARERTWEALRSMVGRRQPHTLAVEEIGRERGGWCWAATHYPGNHESVVTLDSLRVSKGGRFSLHETARVVEQVLGAISSGHRDGVIHGDISAGEVMVNPRGSLFIELYGLRRRLDPVGSGDDACRDEIRSVIAQAWTLLTGISADEQAVFADQARRSIDHRWMQWIERGLDPIMGYGDATEAIGALPENSLPSVEFPAGRARALLGRLSSAVTPRKEPGVVWSRKKSGEGGVG